MKQRKRMMRMMMRTMMRRRADVAAVAAEAGFLVASQARSKIQQGMSSSAALLMIKTNAKKNVRIHQDALHSISQNRILLMRAAVSRRSDHLAMATEALTNASFASLAVDLRDAQACPGVFLEAKPTVKFGCLLVPHHFRTNGPETGRAQRQ